MSSGKNHPSAQILRVAVDTGGTFTDCVWVDQGCLRMLKVFSSSADPSKAIADALARVGHKGPVVLLHGTTVGTNTLLQRKGARVAFVTTAGFEDSIEIGRQARPKLYDLMFERIPPLVDRTLRFGVQERVASDGAVLQAPTREELARVSAKLSDSGAEAIALSTLFSFANSANEVAIARVLEELAIPLSVSHEILPEFREYERASTVVMNAYVQPVMQSYLRRLEVRVAGESPSPRRSRVFVMQSSGGITSLEAATHQPVRTLLSGPAGGVVGAVAMAARSGHRKVLTFDMGGTSTDVALVTGEIRPSNEAELAGLPIRVPILDIHTVGAGGGSIARFDAGGALRVGPESAGADPGPICYGRGVEPTVTDANLLLGRIRPDRFLGGEFTLDLERARAVTKQWLRTHASKLSLTSFAEGVIRVVNANMERALRVVSVERGHDPREFAIVAFGGAGGLHACELASALSIPTVIIPSMPGALSAYGILVSDIVKDYSRSIVWNIDSALPWSRLQAELSRMRAKAQQEFRRERWSGHPQFKASADLRYRGQGFELNVPVSKSLIEDFHADHERRYGYSDHQRPIEIVTLRLRAILKADTNKEVAVFADSEAVVESQRASVVFAGKAKNCAVVPRGSLGSNKKCHGPAVITEYSATTVVPPGAAMYTDRVGNIVIEVATSPKNKGASRAPRNSVAR